MGEYLPVENCGVKDLEKIYLKYFGYITNGFFVDVGAYDGVTSSNTYNLALAGWNGICYEPVPTFYNQCVANHNKHEGVKVIRSCVGDRRGTVEFYVAGTVSTYDEYHSKTKYWEGDYRYAQKIEVPIITLDESLKENNVKSNFEVLSLDVEGAETDVLKFFDINYWKPKMAIVEAQELHPAEELRNQAPFINDYFAKAGYSKIYCDEVNSIFVL